MPQLMKPDVLKMAQMKSAQSPPAPTTAAVAQSGADSKTCSKYLAIMFHAESLAVVIYMFLV